MIYRAVQLIQIFLAVGRADGRTEAFQEVLADLKKATRWRCGDIYNVFYQQWCGLANPTGDKTNKQHIDYAH